MFLQAVTNIVFGNKNDEQKVDFIRNQINGTSSLIAIKL